MTKSVICVGLHKERTSSLDDPVLGFGIPLLILELPALLTVVSQLGEMLDIVWESNHFFCGEDGMCAETKIQGQYI